MSTHPKTSVKMKTVLKIIKLQNFKKVFLWFINGIGKNGEVSFFQKNEGRKTP